MHKMWIWLNLSRIVSIQCARGAVFRAGAQFFFKYGVLYNRDSFNSFSKRFVAVIVSINLALPDISCIVFSFV